MRYNGCHTYSKAVDRAGIFEIFLRSNQCRFNGETFSEINLKKGIDGGRVSGQKIRPGS